ncbi:MAG: peptidase inhibitor family I36 protein [Nocardioidaceae bacterium]
MVIALSLALTAPSTAESPTASAGIQLQVAAQLAERPGGIVTGNRIDYPDGTGFVAIEVGVQSVSDCDSGWFCTWTAANYTGSFTYKSGSGSKQLSLAVRSFWNHRSTIARLYNNAGSASTCYENGVKKATVAVSYQNADSVTLGSAVNC